MCDGASANFYCRPFQLNVLFLAAGRCVCVKLGVCNNWGWKHSSLVPHKWSYISSVDGRRATGIKKSLSAPLLWQPGHEHNMSANICTKPGGVRCGLKREWTACSVLMSQSNRYRKPDQDLSISSQCGQTAVSAGILTKYREKSRASEKWIQSYYL